MIELAQIVAASYMASLALAALALYGLRRRSADVTPLAFATFAIAYALRLGITPSIVRASFGGGDAGWEYVHDGLTYVIAPLAAWLAEALIGPGWRGSLRLLRRSAMALGAIAIAGMFVTGNTEWIIRPYNVVVLGFLAAVAASLWTASADALAAPAMVRGGVGLAAFFILAENLRAIGVLPWPDEIEFIGVAVFVSTLAFAVAERFLRTESRLAAVERELATARRIQQAILPSRVPSVDRFRIAVRYVPMTEVAGDFYDFLTATSTGATILVADVSGHGVPAAIIASMVKIAATSYADSVQDPGPLLTAMSHRLEGELGGQFLTAMCARLDPARSELTYAGAGHPPMLVWRAAERKLERLASDGILIGFMPSSYSSARLSLSRGDRLLLYTDGVLEAVNAAGDFFGDTELDAVVAAHAGGNAHDLAEGILSAMRRWADRAGGFDDDVTIIAIEVV